MGVSMVAKGMAKTVQGFPSRLAMAARGSSQIIYCGLRTVLNAIKPSKGISSNRANRGRESLPERLAIQAANAAEPAVNAANIRRPHGSKVVATGPCTSTQLLLSGQTQLMLAFPIRLASQST